MTTPQNAAALAAGLAHPDYRTGLNQLIDLRSVPGWDRDFIALIKHRAREAEIHDDPLQPALIVCDAPTETGRQLAQVVKRPWTHSARGVAVTVETEPEALAVRGVRRRASPPWIWASEAPIRLPRARFRRRLEA